MNDAHRWAFFRFQPADAQGVKVRPIRRTRPIWQVLMLIALPLWLAYGVVSALVWP